ncbi:MAG TPA: hypothetical protein VGF97_19670 [Rhizomicrobium sp.]|jgi:hypothetical protein
MSEHVYFLTIGLVLGTIVCIFGMKYFAASRQAQAKVLTETAYRSLAEKAVAAQSANATSLSAMQTGLSEINARLSAVEKILKAVE